MLNWYFISYYKWYRYSASSAWKIDFWTVVGVVYYIGRCISCCSGRVGWKEIKQAEQEAIVHDLNKLEKTSNESSIKLAFVKDIFKDIDFNKKEPKERE